ncbi:Transcriptional regulatory protein moc3 [Cytospora mali]|uniref:Transcriptional regulatory protein moc3 n=1 Tax=Cytospora mali TaxID=578113 RepID=A0A194UXC2_CYTMA|nr:Transcriptional regulatory protein moc3 [Valsa mali var. pyri (nom. inval.)]
MVMPSQKRSNISGSIPSLYNCYRLQNMISDSRSSSPPERVVPSGRKGSKKVRTGCITCKIRKVKCDEAKPFCLRCSKTGRTCDGYLDPSVLASRRRLKDSTPHHLILGPLLEYSTPEETRSFYFFQNVTAPYISGNFDAIFWRTVVLQISQTEPAVKHAVLAVSSLHESLTSSPFADSTTPSFALQQYSKAIAYILDQMRNPLTKPLASLITCVLFVCIEFMQGKDKESLIHLEQGRQLLTRLDRRHNNPGMECIVRYIDPLYSRLSLASFLFNTSPVPAPNPQRPRSEIPDTFESIEDLWTCLREFMEQAFRFTQRAQPAKNSSDSIPRETMQMLEVEQDSLLSRLAKLNVAFSLFRASRSKPSPEDAHLVLQMYLYAQYIWLSTALSSSEVVYDDYLSSFAAIVPLAAAYLDLETSSQYQQAPAQPSVLPTESSQHMPEIEHRVDGKVNNFAFETHIIPPLYYVATKCRHPLIRRSALNLLRRNTLRREKLWQASVMGALAGHIVSREELWAQGQNISATPVSVSAAPGTHMSLGGVYHTAQLSGMVLPQNLQRDDPSQDIPLHTIIIPTEETPTGLSNNSAVTPLPQLHFEDFETAQVVEHVIDPTLDVDVHISSSLSQAPSLTSSIDGRSSSSAIETAIEILSSSSNDTSIWQQLQQQQQIQRQNGPFKQASILNPSPRSSYSCAQNQVQQLIPLFEQPGALIDCVSHSSSEVSSPDAYEQYHQSTSTGHPHQQYQHHTPTLLAPSLSQQHGNLMGPHIPKNLVTEAPFGLPEELRVHDATVGPEIEDGSWVAVFRKLHGVDVDWDV